MNKIKCFFGMLAVIVVAVLGIWVAVVFKVNIGKLLSRLSGGKVNPTPDPKDLEGLPVGSSYEIINNINPLRDKGIVELSNGVSVELPKGIIDTDVKKVVVVSQGVIGVVKKGASDLTVVFDDPVTGSLG
jgi:hypothetical protein